MEQRARREWQALGLSLLVHAAFLLVTWNATLFSPSPATDAAAAEREPTVELALEPVAPDVAGAVPATAAAAERPRAYLDVPERLAAAEPPERADYLGIVNTRAADEKPGGAPDGTPAAPLQGEAPQIAIQRENPEAGAGGTMILPNPQPVPGAPPAATPPARSEIARGAEAAAGGGWSLPPGRPDVRAGAGRGGAGNAAREGTDDGETEGLLAQAKRAQTWQWDLGAADPLDLLAQPRAGRPAGGGNGGAPGDRMFQFDQFAVGNREGNALLFGPYRLNTYAWNYAWWMQQFGQALRRNWIAPYAYRLGIISGLTEMRVDVERDGRLGALEVRQREGHESLHFASEAAVRGAAPFTALPADFPEPRLEIILTLVYPDWAQLLREQQPPAGAREQEPPPRRGRR